MGSTRRPTRGAPDSRNAAVLTGPINVSGAIPVNVAQQRDIIRNRSARMGAVPGQIRTADEFRAAFYEALAAANNTGRRLGTIFLRTNPALFLDLTADSQPSQATLTELLQNPRRVLPAADPQPEAEKLGIGFYRMLYHAAPELRGKVFIGLMQRGLYGIPSHPRSPLVPEAVKIATLAVRLLKEHVDVLVFALSQTKADTALWDHLLAYLRVVVLPLSMARGRRKAQNPNPLLEGSFMESCARSVGGLWMQLMRAPDFGPTHAKVWGRLLSLMLRAIEVGPEHPVYRTPARDDIRSVVYNLLLALVTVYPAALGPLLTATGTVPPNELMHGIATSAPSAVGSRKLAASIATKLRGAVQHALRPTPDGIIPAGSAHQFVADLYTELAPHLIVNQRELPKILAAFRAELLA